VVAVTPDGQHAVSASHDQTMKVWEVETGRELRTLTGHTNTITEVAMTPDGRRAVSASDDRTLKVWDLETGKLLSTFTCDSSAHCCTFADNSGNLIVAGDESGSVHFLRFEEPKPRN
jgi:WD40 repeat protein